MNVGSIHEQHKSANYPTKRGNFYEHALPFISSPDPNRNLTGWKKDPRRPPLDGGVVRGHLPREQRLEGPSEVYASPVGASGRVYLAGRNGTSLVLKNADKFEILATNKLDEKFDASPAVVGKELFLRGHEYLYCVAEK